MVCQLLILKKRLWKRKGYTGNTCERNWRMKDGKLFIIILIAVLISGSGGYILAKSSNTPLDTAGQQKDDTAKSADVESNPYDGSNLTLMKMYDNLNSTSGDEFDRRLMEYLLAMNLNQTGMLRQAESKSQKAQFKELARIQMKQNDEVLELLYRWQKEWGYTDH